jgi:hypothetical protein
MSKVPEWAYLLVAGAAFALSWLAWRLDRLGKQLEAVSSLIRQEMAELLGNEDRAREILNFVPPLDLELGFDGITDTTAEPRIVITQRV